jgi:hypothetical protein
MGSSVEARPVVHRFTGGCCVTDQMAHRYLVTNRYIIIHFRKETINPHEGGYMDLDPVVWVIIILW